MVIWITGVSAAGKTTICNSIRDLVKPKLPELVILDGDVVRAAFGHNLSHSEADRVIQVKRLQSMSKVLSEQGLVVLVGVLYAHPGLLTWNRENFREYFEIYLKVSLDTVRRRDPKGLYAKAAAGKMRNVVGIDIPWHEPVAPHMTIDQDAPRPPDVLARQIAESITRLRAALP